MKDLENKTRAYALKNAVAHEGKAMQGPIISSLFNEGLKKSEVGKYAKKISEIIFEVNSLSFEEQKKQFKKLENEVSERDQREGLPELEKVPKTGVVMRFSPSPSGPMHLGHIFTGMPTSLYVKKYGGKFYLRIEDTNPENIDPDAYKMIPEEAKWIFGNVHECYCQSDRMEKYYTFSKKLIEKEVAYICTCSSEKFKEFVEAKKNCPCRKLNVKENLERWKKMIDKNGFNEGDAVLRFKSSMKDLNPAMRDFPLARIVLAEHPRQKKKYRVWPLMNLCVTLDDIEFGSTHIIRAKDHIDNAKRQAMIFKAMNKPLPVTHFLGRYKFTDLELSCSKTKQKIKEGQFFGWDDIRLPFISALKKRGYQKKAFEKLVIQRGISEVDKVIDKKDFFELLNHFNREILRDISKKASFEKVELREKNTLDILMPDNSLVYCKSDLDKKKIKDGDIFYFDRFGYCRYNKDKNQFWFCHE